MATTVKMYSGNKVVNVWYKRLADQNVAHFYTACIVFVLLEIQYRITIYNNVFWALNQHNIKQHGHILKPSNFLSIEFLIFFNLKYDSLLSILPRNAILQFNLFLGKKFAFFGNANGVSRFSASWPFWPLLTLNDLSELTNQKVAGLKICGMKSCKCRCLICWNCPRITEVIIKSLTPTPIF